MRQKLAGLDRSRVAGFDSLDDRARKAQHLHMLQNLVVSVVLAGGLLISDFNIGYSTCQIWQVIPSSMIGDRCLLCSSELAQGSLRRHVFDSTYKLFKNQSKTARP